MPALTILLFMGLLSACASSDLIRDAEYAGSTLAFRAADPERALTAFPKKETGGFITTLEKSWLGLWSDQNLDPRLLHQAKTLEERKYTSLLRETEYFFVNESEEGYIPAEHEIVVMHLTTATYFLKSQDWVSARVEVKKASYFLESFFREDQKHFDDPGLRIWIASLWAALGEWDEALVDFRRAEEMTKDPRLRFFTNSPKPPPQLTLIFQGDGPRVHWETSQFSPTFQQNDELVSYRFDAPTLPWYQRHTQRNSLIRDQVMKSNYMSQFYGLRLRVGSERTVGVISSTAVKVAGVAVGTAIIAGGIYLAASAGASTGSGELIGGVLTLGFGLGHEIWKGGDALSHSFKKSSQKIEAEGSEDLKIYRFVRFLPSWISITESTAPLASEREFSVQAPKSKTKLIFAQKF